MCVRQLDQRRGRRYVIIDGQWQLVVVIELEFEVEPTPMDPNGTAPVRSSVAGITGVTACSETPGSKLALGQLSSIPTIKAAFNRHLNYSIPRTHPMYPTSGLMQPHARTVF